jgi:hypothetical protein
MLLVRHALSEGFLRTLLTPVALLMCFFEVLWIFSPFESAKVTSQMSQLNLPEALALALVAGIVAFVSPPFVSALFRLAWVRFAQE